MDQTPAHLPLTSALAAAVERWRGRRRLVTGLAALPCVPVVAERVQTLSGPREFRALLLERIAGARKRILISALYLQDDDSGREVLASLYAARAACPQLQIAVFVDWHRAQRGLIGKAASSGNAALYVEMAQRLGSGVPIYGVPVQIREWMGVMHLKGFVIDDALLYSGASINDVYLHRGDRYRLDRYHLIENRPLADSVARLMTHVLRANAAVCPLDTEARSRTRSLRGAIARLRRVLAKGRYAVPAGVIASGEVGVTPLLGFGRRDNQLNTVILQLIARARRRLVLFTPYFNLPGAVQRAIGRKIGQGCTVTIVVGDKTANDFYISPEEAFTPIGALPYLYEANLRRFCRAHQESVDRHRLHLHLWRQDSHSFHLKGLLVDDDYALITGSNLNPRAWRLDLENGLLIHDPESLLAPQHQAELERVLAQTRRLSHHSQLEDVDSYPPPVRRLLRRLARTRADRLVNQVL
ncbi:MAG TPA: CDP-diacylglycerol--serine O-phosphatidyltransferase [Accumulibacter sp.]|uniref:CDP-diacylglycerol--serine O-phosphatidyltransferase n=1 Tax=Accumulibacter sp. TaxID=2053492 RepID=UPI0025EA60EF|nr:CDP-diacylglycerol--serine O-phosphatidyltransferase [Accumulibacter sp.]MCM8599277.1 CDP-diacylglycerol--serine O-phosphatidyltransferase [Accumulibacter sp.]MCM8663438.1 CDP-diacylglycerol--serine O-phosphatidyltransferase [Accumulibacter sp.]HNC51537.1 CDP-diacylglycerol--serine O-phosphatidyltransferase [Accumulibacter sp.]